MLKLAKMVEESRQVYNRLQVLEQEFNEASDPYRNQAFRTDVLVAFSHAFDLAYDLNRLWSQMNQIPAELDEHEGEFDPFIADKRNPYIPPEKRLQDIGQEGQEGG